MKLSEAIRLGSALIGERRNIFLCLEDMCGCALGAACVAVDDSLLSPALPYRSIYKATLSNWPWTKRPAVDFPSLATVFPSSVLWLAVVQEYNVAQLISYAHCLGVPRLEIGDLIAEIEPEEPEAVEAQVEEVAHV